MKKVFMCFFVLAFVVCFCAAPALSQGIFPISPSYSGADDVPLDDVDTVQAYLHQSRSYECSVMVTDFNVGTDEYYVFETSATDPDSDNVALVANGDEYPAIAPVDGVDAFHNRTRVSLIAQKTGVYKFTVEDAFGLNNTENNTIRCRETTLYGGYNRFFAGVAIAELQNASSSDIDVFITIINSGGDVVVDDQQETAAANTRTDIIFANLPAGNFGQMMITHRAPFGALSGTVAEYDFNADGSITLKRERSLKNAQRR